MPPAFALSLQQAGAGQGQLRLGGTLRLAEAAPLWDELRRLEAGTARGQRLDFEMSGVEQIDGGAMALLACLRSELHRRGVESEFLAADERVQRLIHLYGGDLAVARLRPRRPVGTLDQLGRATLAVLLELKLVLAFFGQLVVSWVGLARAPRSANWRELPATMERAGADAVPIIMILNFLVGLAMAFQAAEQLARFGANILVADLIGISVTRELGPLMAAILVCGRSGAAFAAELGSMQVNGEIDALRTMGFAPMRYLVIPRSLALALVLPLLTVLADLAGLLGGLVVGVWVLDLSPRGYLYQTARVVSVWDLSTGIIKAAIFGFAISMIACQQGLATHGGAEEVGRRTTSAVVASLFSVIVIDAAASILFRLAGV
jgi:phospholipid/cholesterol/gamma-HCH transport system permease protein